MASAQNRFEIRLQDQPFKVLAILLEHPGELVTREDLKQRLWSESEFGDFDQGINVAIKKIRTALRESSGNPRFIETLARRGTNVGGGWELYKTSVNGQAAPVQITKGGGFSAFESFDGAILYYSKWDKPGIYSMPTSGGPENAGHDRPASETLGSMGA